MSTLDPIYRGDDAYLDGTITKNGAAQDITGCTLWWTLKKSKTDPDSAAILQKTNGSGITIVSAAGGTFTVRINSTDLSSIDSERLYYWDVQIKDAANIIQTVMTGTVVIALDITVRTT